jgi:hypothetical protein
MASILRLDMSYSSNSSPATNESPVDCLESPVRAGLVEQGHVPAIETMLLEGKAWEQIGREIGWDAVTAAQHYAVYAVHRIRALEASAEDSGKAAIPTRAEAAFEAPRVLIDVDCALHPGSPFAAIVFSTCYENPVNAYLALEKLLTHQGVEGEVLFDLLAANGTDERTGRYVCCNLKDGRFEREWGHPLAPEDLGYDYRTYCDAFYRNYRAEVDLSLLPQELKARFEPATEG